MSNEMSDNFRKKSSIGDHLELDRLEVDHAPLDASHFLQHRVFLNNVDTFNGRHIAEYISEKIYGATKAENYGEEGVEEEEEGHLFKPPPGNKYEIIGTLKYIFSKQSEDVLSIISENDHDHYLEEIMRCRYIIFDISEDESEIPKALSVLSYIDAAIDKVKTVGAKHFQAFNEERVFILISTVMTWGNTKPIDPDEPDTPFNESDYKKRKAHPNFAEHIRCEREVVLIGRKHKEKLKTYVVCAGITYGFEEDHLFFLFKLAWNNEKCIPVFGTGTIPVLHVQDLAKVLHAVCENAPKKPQFILAVEQTPCKLKQIVKALSKEMGRNKIREVTKEEAFLYHNMTQNLYDRFTVNLNMEPVFIVDDLAVEFRNDLNIAENMKAIVSEFRIARNLKPMRILIHGPPASGKTRLAKLLADYYGVHYISVKSMIEETLQELKNNIEEELNRKKNKAKLAESQPEDQDDEAEEAEEEEEVEMEEIEEKIRDIESAIANSDNGRLPDVHIINLLKTFLNSNVCQNQGYVLDGYPKTMEQVLELFGPSAEGGEEEAMEEEGEEPVPKISIVPVVVIALEADDTFLCERVMNLPESEVQNTHYTEEHMLRRLAEYRNVNTEDNTILNFFDEIEIHPIVVDVAIDDTVDLKVIFENISTTLGPPIGFELTPEEKEELMKCQEAAGLLIAENERIEEELLTQKALEEYQLKMEERIRLLEQYQLEEEKLLAAQCEPLRGYLMQFIFPTLTEGLLEVARLKPKDPVDYLAEYLFKCNPEGRMFDPGYTRKGEKIEEVPSKTSQY